MRDILCEMSLQEYPARGEKKTRTYFLEDHLRFKLNLKISIYKSNDNLFFEQLLLSGRLLETLV